MGQFTISSISVSEKGNKTIPKPHCTIYVCAQIVCCAPFKTCSTQSVDLNAYQSKCFFEINEARRRWTTEKTTKTWTPQMREQWKRKTWTITNETNHSIHVYLFQPIIIIIIINSTLVLSRINVSVSFFSFVWLWLASWLTVALDQLPFEHSTRSDVHDQKQTNY